MKKLSKDYIGCEVSCGTLREEDLIESFLHFLWETEKLTNVNLPPIKKIYADCRGKESKAYFLYEDLYPIMDDVAPEGTFFGAHPGDGSCIGFWEAEEED